VEKRESRGLPGKEIEESLRLLVEGKKTRTTLGLRLNRHAKKGRDHLMPRMTTQEKGERKEPRIPQKLFPLGPYGGRRKRHWICGEKKQKRYEQSSSSYYVTCNHHNHKKGKKSKPVSKQPVNVLKKGACSIPAGTHHREKKRKGTKMKNKKKKKTKKKTDHPKKNEKESTFRRTHSISQHLSFQKKGKGRH